MALEDRDLQPNLGIKYFYYWVINKFRKTELLKRIDAQLEDAQESSGDSDVTEPNNLDVRLKGACMVIIPGVGTRCKNNIRAERCREIELENLDSGIRTSFRLGRCPT